MRGAEVHLQEERPRTIAHAREVLHGLLGTGVIAEARQRLHDSSAILEELLRQIQRLDVTRARLLDRPPAVLDVAEHAVRVRGVVHETAARGIVAPEILPGVVDAEDGRLIAMSLERAPQIGLIVREELRDRAEAVGVAVAAGDHRDPRRHALAVDGVVVVEDHAAPSEGVERGRPAIGVAHETGAIASHLVGGDHDEVPGTARHGVNTLHSMDRRRRGPRHETNVSQAFSRWRPSPIVFRILRCFGIPSSDFLVA